MASRLAWIEERSAGCLSASSNCAILCASVSVLLIFAWGSRDRRRQLDHLYAIVDKWIVLPLADKFTFLEQKQPQFGFQCLFKSLVHLIRKTTLRLSMKCSLYMLRDIAAGKEYLFGQDVFVLRFSKCLYSPTILGANFIAFSRTMLFFISVLFSG